VKIPTLTSLLPAIPPELRHTLQSVEQVLDRAGRMVQTLHYAREGTMLDKGLAAASILGQALDALLPYKSPKDELLELGYVGIDTGLADMFCDQLAYTTAVREEIDLGPDEGIRIVYWSLPDQPRAVAAIYEGDQIQSGPYVQRGGMEALASVLQTAVWRNGPSLMLTTSTSFTAGRSSREIVLEPMPPAGIYRGEPGLEWWTNRLQRHAKPRTILIVGVTGIGKSTLGRLLAREVLGAEARTLKIAASVVTQVPHADLLHLATFLRPDVLLIDDFQFGDEDDRDSRRTVSDGGLALLEALHDRVRFVILTHMAARDVDPEAVGGGQGSTYIPGFRPGRVDEILYLKRPSPRIIEAILHDHLGGTEGVQKLGITPALWKEIVERCRGLTGAYLVEVAHRLAVYGLDRWKSEIDEVKRQCPWASEARTLRRHRSPRRVVLTPAQKKKKLEREARRAEKESARLIRQAESIRKKVEKAEAKTAPPPLEKA